MGNLPSNDKKNLKSMLEKCQKETKYTPEDISSFYKQFIEEFPSGRITESIFIKKMVTKHNDMNIGDFASHLFRCYDSDNNGEINFREFLMTMHITSNGDIEQRLRWVFNLYDIDGNGELSNEEIQDILKAFLKFNPPEFEEDEDDLESLAEKWARDIFIGLDKAGDDSINFNEFVKGATQTEVMKKLIFAARTE